MSYDRHHRSTSNNSVSVNGSPSPLFPSPRVVLWTLLLCLSISCSAGCAGRGTSIGTSTPARGALEITTKTLPAGSELASYAATLNASGGIPPYKWTALDGQMPAGLVLDSDSGFISGNPTGAGSFSFVATLRDAANSSISDRFSISISQGAAPAISTVVPSSGPTRETLIKLSAFHSRSS
jgi:hypothetical protein